MWKGECGKHDAQETSRLEDVFKRRLTDGQTDRRTDWLSEGLTGWLTNRLAEWLTDILTDWLTDWLTDLLTDWLTDWPTDRLTDWLTDWPTFYRKNRPRDSWADRMPSYGRKKKNTSNVRYVIPFRWRLHTILRHTIIFTKTDDTHILSDR